MKVTTAVASVSLAGLATAANTCECGPGGYPAKETVTVTETVCPSASLSSVVAPVR